MKFLVYIGGVGSAAAASTAGYLLVNSNSTNDEKINEKTKSTSIKESSNSSGKETIENEEGHRNTKDLTKSPEEQTIVQTKKEEQSEIFDGYLLFNVDNNKYKSNKNPSKLGKAPIYEVSLLESKNYETWLKEEQEDSDEDEPGIRNFTLEVKNEKKELEKYLEELNKEFISLNIRDWSLLKKYFEENKTNKKLIDNFDFENKISEKILEKFKKTEK